MKIILVSIIGAICIVLASVSTYLFVDTNRNQEIQEMKEQYESNISSLNVQIVNLSTQVDILEDKLDYINYEDLSKLRKFRGEWKLQDIEGNSTDDPVYTDFNVHSYSGSYYTKATFKDQNANDTKGFFYVHPNIPAVLLLENYMDLSLEFYYEFTDNNTLVLTYDSVNATYTQI